MRMKCGEGVSLPHEGEVCGGAVLQHGGISGRLSA